MGELDRMLDAIENIHAAAFDSARWPTALTAVSELAGGMGCVLELIDRASLKHLIFESHGVPVATEIDYLEHYVAISPRMAAAVGRPSGELLWDYKFFDEHQISHSEFYTDFLQPQGMRYFLGGVFASDAGLFGSVTVQYSPRQGHADAARIEAMRRLAPHVGQAIATRRQLADSGQQIQSLVEAVDWLADGAALLDRQGRVLRVNSALAAMAASGDILSLRAGRLEFARPATERAFQQALDAIRRLRAGELRDPAWDFVAMRMGGRPPCRISVRPLNGVAGAGGGGFFLIVRDPMAGISFGEEALCRKFGLTPAEAHLAVQLCAGVSPGAYARKRRVSPNTVYTHLYRLKDKCGCADTVQLIAMLNAVRIDAPATPGV